MAMIPNGLDHGQIPNPKKILTRKTLECTITTSLIRRVLLMKMGKYFTIQVRKKENPQKLRKKEVSRNMLIMTKMTKISQMPKKITLKKMIKTVRTIPIF